MRVTKSLTLFNALSFLVQTGLFFSVQFRLVGQQIAREITPAYTDLLSPSPGMAFIGWGVIYTALSIFCLYHLLKAFSHQEKHPANNDILRVDVFFIINNIAAVGWIITTVNGKLPASLALLAFQLFMLGCIHYRLQIYKRYRRIKSTLCTQLPLSIYAAWLCVLLMTGINEWLQLDTNHWHIVSVAALVFLALLMVLLRHNIFFGFMIVAGLYASILKLETLSLDTYEVILAAWIGIGVVSIACALKLVFDIGLQEPPVAYQRAAYD